MGFSSTDGSTDGQLKLVSIELTNRCRKCCSWCYNASNPDGDTFWKPEILAAFIKDLVANGIESISFGGGEPLEYPHFWELMDLVREIPAFKTLTTNGLEMGPKTPQKLAKTLQKIHVSIHDPSDVPGAILKVLDLSRAGVRAGINFLVKGEDEEAEKRAARQLRESGIKPEEVIFLPLRREGFRVPLDYFKRVASEFSPRFQSTFCLLGCRRSDRFASVDWQGRASWCSFTGAKTKMEEFTYKSMVKALRAKEMVNCG